MTDSVATNLVNALDRSAAMSAYHLHGLWMLTLALCIVLGFTSGRGR